MTPWIADMAKHLAEMVLTLAVGAAWHSITGIIKDVNAFFQKVRCLEERVSKLEKGK